MIFRNPIIAGFSIRNMIFQISVFLYLNYNTCISYSKTGLIQNHKGWWYQWQFRFREWGGGLGQSYNSKKSDGKGRDRGNSSGRSEYADRKRNDRKAG